MSIDVRSRLGWAPSIAIKDGLRKTYDWIQQQVESEQAASLKSGDTKSATDYSKSEVVVQTTDSLEALGSNSGSTNGVHQPQQQQANGVH